MIFFPNCKINIGLDVLRRRADGYHDIRTVMYPVRGLCDILEIVPCGTPGISFAQSGIDAGEPEENICVKAYGLMAARYAAIGGVKAHLHKIIPVGAGLGGGSSDAAHMIKGLNRIFLLGLDEADMEAIGAELGSDVPFFIRNEPMLAEGRGELLSPCAVKLEGMRLVIAKPDMTVPTAAAYAGITPCIPQRSLAERISDTADCWKYTVANAFERHIFMANPIPGTLKQRLYALGAVYASMSGSGPSVYGIFNDGLQRRGTENHTAATAGDILRGEFNDLFVYQELMY